MAVEAEWVAILVAFSSVVASVLVAAWQSWQARKVQTLEFCSLQLASDHAAARSALSDVQDLATMEERRRALRGLARGRHRPHIDEFFRACNRIGMGVREGLLRRRTVAAVWSHAWFARQWALYQEWMEVKGKTVRKDTYPGFREMAQGPEAVRRARRRAPR